MHMDHMINQGKMIDQLDLFFDVKIKNWSRLEGYGLYCKLANETWSMYSKKKGSLSIRLTDNKEIRYFNKKWRNKDLATNVLAFPSLYPKINSRIIYIGDIVIAYEIVKKEANFNNIPIVNHVSHLIVHGILHLIGFSHDNVTDEKKMKKIEKKILNTVGIIDPYAS